MEIGRGEEEESGEQRMEEGIMMIDREGEGREKEG